MRRTICLYFAHLFLKYAGKNYVITPVPTSKEVFADAPLERPLAFLHESHHAL